MLTHEELVQVALSNPKVKAEFERIEREEMPTSMLAEFDAETRFRVRAERGADRQERGLALLEKAAGDK